VNFPLGLRFHHVFGCFFKRCHRYAKCEIQENKAVCVCPKACPRNYSPVCGTDWKTYSNLCELRKHACDANNRTRLRYYGTCKFNLIIFVQCGYKRKPNWLYNVHDIYRFSLSVLNSFPRNPRSKVHEENLRANFSEIF
jgi:hypothetical protein